MSKFFKAVWLALGFLLAGMPILQTPVLVGRDLWEGKTSNGLDVSQDRSTMVTFLYIAMGIQMLLFAAIGFGFYQQTPDKSGDRNAEQEENKEVADDVVQDAEDNAKVADIVEALTMAPFARPEIVKLMQHGVAVPHVHAPLDLAATGTTGGGWTDRGVAPRPRDERGRYLPLIRVNK